MAVPRVLAARSLCTALTSAVRPKGAATLRSWRALSVATQPSWRRQELATNGRPNLLRALSPSYRWSSTVSLTVPELEEQVLGVLKMFDKVKPENVTLEAHFINDLGMDSLDAVEVVMAFEDEFGCEVTDEEAEKIFCAKDAVELLKTKLGVH